jgi:hypothetical protein
MGVVALGGERTTAELMRLSVNQITAQKLRVQFEVKSQTSSEPTEAFYMNMVNKGSVFIFKKCKNTIYGMYMKHKVTL